MITMLRSAPAPPRKQRGAAEPPREPWLAASPLLGVYNGSNSTLSWSH